ncbi:MAG: hypothetical protein HY303_17360 [Candidatus Wallbacteria bacterium]|nr:hypothetical protein [Candidatus Wallbacteria bacterium]
MDITVRKPGAVGALRSLVWGVALAALIGLPLRKDPPAADPMVRVPEALAGNAIGGRLWTHIDRPTRDREKFRMYQFNPAGSDGKGTGWYHEGDFTEWMTETLRYEIHGSELKLFFDLAGEKATVRFRVERGRGSNGEDLKLTLTPDPRRYWKPYEYFASSKSRAGAETLPDGEQIF